MRYAYYLIVKILPQSVHIFNKANVNSLMDYINNVLILVRVG